MYLNGIKNEERYVNIISGLIKNGVSNFVFKDDHGRSSRYSNIINVEMANNHGKRKNGILYKSDVNLISKDNIYYPLSIKMSNVQTSWESADSLLKNELIKFINCYGRINIPGGNCIRIDDHGINMHNFVFGNDILENSGLIVIQTIHDSNFTIYNHDTAIINCKRIFRNMEEVNSDDVYKPCIAVRKSSTRNKKNEKIKGYRIEVIPHVSSVSILDIIDLI